MKNRKYPLSLFVTGFIFNILFRFFWLFVPATILLIIGIFVDWCMYAGLALLVSDIIISFIEQMKIRHTMLSDSDNEQFREFQDVVSQDGNVFENIRNSVENSIIEQSDNDTEQNNIVMNVYDYICQKCEYGDAIEKLNKYERVIFITQTLEQEVNNGGFSQFFYNSSGDFSNELLDAFTQIGAAKTATICKKAISVFNGKIPLDRTEREELLDNMKIETILDKCDDDFYAYEDDLERLNYEYIIKHRDYFKLF